MAAEELTIREYVGGVRFAVRVSPRASHSGIAGVHAGALKISLTAPPVEGAANAALIRLLSDALHIPKRAISIDHGDHNRTKALTIEGVTGAQIRALLLRPA